MRAKLRRVFALAAAGVAAGLPAPGPGAPAVGDGSRLYDLSHRLSALQTLISQLQLRLVSCCDAEALEELVRSGRVGAERLPELVPAPAPV